MTEQLHYLTDSAKIYGLNGFEDYRITLKLVGIFVLAKGGITILTSIEIFRLTQACPSLRILLTGMKFRTIPKAQRCTLLKPFLCLLSNLELKNTILCKLMVTPWKGWTVHLH